jgi:hypothetical protein
MVGIEENVKLTDNLPEIGSIIMAQHGTPANRDLHFPCFGVEKPLPRQQRVYG